MALIRTDTSGMREIYDRYTKSLPSSLERAPLHKKSKTIIILGSTGFVGPYIVSSLLNDDNNAEIICFNRTVAGKERTELSLERFRNDLSTQRSRLHFSVVSMTKPNFGLSETEAGLLSSKVDEFIFNAWDPNWGKQLWQFQDFLEAVRRTIDYCASAPRRPRIIFLSSICAVGDWPLVYPEQPKIPEKIVWDRRCAMPHGYGESKCVAEQILARASEICDIPVGIVRAGQIGGPSAANRGMWPRQGWVYSIIMASRKTGTFPTRVQPLDWIPVDSLAAGIANIVRIDSSLKDIDVFNVVHPAPAPWDLLLRSLRRDFGFKAKPTSLPSWLEQLDSTTIKLHGFLRATMGGREKNMSFENDRAATILPKVGPITEEVLKRWLQNWGIHEQNHTARL